MADVTIVPGIHRSGGLPVHWPDVLRNVEGAVVPVVAVLRDVGAQVAGIAPGARIATARGFRRIETLEPGERVITRDNGFAAVVAVQRQRAAAAAVVTLRAGAVRGLESDVTLGGGHGLLWTGARVAEALGTREGFLRACELQPRRPAVEGFVTLFVPVLERQEVIFAEGAAIASALPPGGMPARRQMTQDEARRVLRV